MPTTPQIAVGIFWGKEIPRALPHLSLSYPPENPRALALLLQPSTHGCQTRRKLHADRSLSRLLREDGRKTVEAFENVAADSPKVSAHGN